ncbi:hypothetical protein [Guyparkeria sp.]|uniref:hypothetical protein n=1 Tax=Guyparkeria sp. TaxID=2035736 RepID=UPI003970DF7D
MEPTTQDERTEHRHAERVINEKRQFEATKAEYLKEVDGIIASLRASVRRSENEGAEFKKRMAESREKTVRARSEAEEAAERAREAEAAFETTVTKVEQRINHLDDGSAAGSAKAARLRRKLDRVIDERNARLAAVRIRLANSIEPLLAKAPTPDPHDSRERRDIEEEQRHKAEMRRLEIERARLGVEAEKLAVAELRRMDSPEPRQTEGET